MVGNQLQKSGLLSMTSSPQGLVKLLLHVCAQLQGLDMDLSSSILNQYCAMSCSGVVTNKLAQ